MKRSAHSAAAGFTLVEVLAALLFLALAIPAVLGAINASSRAGEIAERSAIAGQLAENELSQLVLDQTNTTGGSSGGNSGDRGDFGTEYPGYRWEMKQEAWTVSPDLTQYTVRVYYSVRGDERSVEMSTVLVPP